MDQELTQHQNYDEYTAKQTLRQVIRYLTQATSLEAQMSPDGRTFNTKPCDRKGIISASAEIDGNGQMIRLKLEIFQFSGNVRISARDFLIPLSNLSSSARLCPVEDRDDSKSSVYVSLEIKASPLSPSRAARLMGEIKNVDGLGESLQNELPGNLTDQELKRLYQGSDHLSVIYPWQLNNAALSKWSRDTVDLLMGAPIGLFGPPILERFMLACVAHELRGFGMSIARLRASSMQPNGLVEVIHRAPGILAVPAVCVSIATNRYEISNEMQGVLASLAASGNTAVFTGSSFQELKSLFAGQGNHSDDPLSPVVRRCEVEVPLHALVEFAVDCEARVIGGLSKADEARISDEILESLDGYERSKQQHMLPVIARRLVRLWDKGQQLAPTGDFISSIYDLKETFGGIASDKRGLERSPEVHQKFLKSFTSRSLAGKLKDKLLGQDDALDQVVLHLRQQILTNPRYQPLSYLAQGTPGSGKSESARTLADILDIPYINIDVASAGDSYTVKSMLFGSARGLVGSYQQGKLQEAAAHQAGAVVEVSDMDHTSALVCSLVGDIFLSILETGQAQSATGVTFGCANLIFCFSFNLPGLTDQEIRRGGIGFKSPSSEEIRRSVLSELQKILSPAFLSRIGNPIIFEPVGDPAALAEIARRTIRSAISAIAERLGIKIGDIVLDDGVENAVVESVKASILCFGVRALLERARSLSALAFLEIYERAELSGRVLIVSSDSEGELIIRPDEKPE